jgi:metallo-beta-lactamase class B
LIEASVRKLGFAMRDIHILLNTQAHFDHAAGFAKMKELTGARLMISAPDADVLERGGRGDFYFGDTSPFPRATVDRRLNDGDVVRLGGVTLTAHLTPGHTKGCTTWTFDARDSAHSGATRHVLVLGGLTILDPTPLVGNKAYPTIAQDYERTYATLKRLPCDIFLGAHLSYYDGAAKLARLRSGETGANPFVDPDGFRTFVAKAEQRFRNQLAKEKATPAREAAVTSNRRDRGARRGETGTQDFIVNPMKTTPR